MTRPVRSGNDGRRWGQDGPAGARVASWRLVTALGPGGLDEDGAPTACDGATNMAVDHALFESVKRGGRPVLRFYRWRPACLSLGRNQPARGRYDGAGLRPGLDVVRRPTGGLAVDHDVELTYSVACPVHLLGSPRETYARVNRALVAGLRALGVDARLAGSAASAPSPDDASGVCFRAPAPGEVVAGGAKLVGSAQRCESRTLLQHGSILLGGTQRRAVAHPTALPGAVGGATPGSSDVAGGAARALGEVAAPAVATLERLLGRMPAVADVLGALAQGFEGEVGTGLAPDVLAVAELERLPALVRHYGSEAWTWRR